MIDIFTQIEPEAPVSNQDEPMDKPKIACELCDREFTSNHGLAMHMRRTHGKKSKRSSKAKTARARPSFNRESAIRLVVGDSIPVKMLTRIERWLEEGAAIRKEVG